MATSKKNADQAAQGGTQSAQPGTVSDQTEAPATTGEPGTNADQNAPEPSDGSAHAAGLQPDGRGERREERVNVLGDGPTGGSAQVREMSAAEWEDRSRES